MPLPFTLRAALLIAAIAPSAARAETQAQPQQDLRAIVAQSAEVINGRAPIAAGNGATITRARANGLELVTSLTVAGALTPEALAALRSSLPGVQCGNPAVADLIRRGVRFTYDITGARRRTARITISACPNTPSPPAG